jgi:hypothetical protein
VSKGYNEKARRSLQKINKSDPDYNPEPALEAYIKDHERAVAESKQSNGWKELFTDKVECACCMSPSLCVAECHVAVRKLVSVFGILAGQRARAFSSASGIR